MERPSLDPGLPATEPPPGPRRKAHYQHLRTAATALAHVLTADVVPHLHPRKHRPRGPLLNRFLGWLAFRLAVIPIFVIGFASLLVYIATHPAPPGPDADPASIGLYYEPLNLVADDEVRSESWYVPVLDAKKVVELGELALASKYPAVVLVHDFAASRHQMLPLVRPLHDSGMIVLVLGLRGEGAGPAVGQTFGLTESRDVVAAVRALQRRPGVDPKRIAVLGAGSGATAALLAARAEPAVSALALFTPPSSSSETVLFERIGPQEPYLRWLTPICSQVLEYAYSVNTHDLDRSTHRGLLASRPVLFLERHTDPRALPAATLAQLRSFLTQNFAIATAN